MATLNSMSNPSFALFPINNDRTGWRPFGLPVIMVVPNRRDINDNPIPNSQVFNIKVFIENVPREARVAGHDHIGMRFPDRELFAVTVDSLGLAERIIKPNNYTFMRDNDEIEYEQAQTGDLFEYITSTGIKDTITYIKGANYYDLSDIEIDFEHLPSDRYNLVYQAEYFNRIISADGLDELLCIDTSQTSLAIFKFNVKHPGEVIEEFERLTPPPYLTNSARSKDSTLALYRPFTDILQDVADEQDLLESINWVFDAPAEAIPYLSQLLGWDLPYFPESLDKLRRAVLRRTVEFQNLAGSRRAIIHLFRLFGFEILISNLWWSSDGMRLIRPDEKLPLSYQNQEITIAERCQIDILLSEYNTEGFGIFEIPLIYRPQEKTDLDNFAALRDGGSITIDCYFVENNSEAYNELLKISSEIKNNVANYGDDSGGCGLNVDGSIIPIGLINRMAGNEIVGYSQISVTGKLGQASHETLVGPEIPLKKECVSFNRETNILNISLNGALDYEGKSDRIGRSVFAFATYKRQEFVVPDIIKHLQSNRFDIQVVTEDLIEFADPTFLEFAIEFLFRLKAFHSLLNKIIFRADLHDTYEVTDWCVGGNITQRYDTDAGTLQVPPAIIPNLPLDINDCTLLDPINLGYKYDDIVLRLRKLANLPEEHAAWKALDDRANQPIGDTRLKTSNEADRESCKFTHRGQDRIVGTREEKRESEKGPSPNANTMASGFSSNTDESPIDEVNNGIFNAIVGSSNNDSSIFGLFVREYTEIRKQHCELDGNTDYCYKGRVDDELLYRPTLIGNENVISKPCSIDLGNGAYYLYPTHSKMVVKGVRKPCLNSLTSHSIFSGGAQIGNDQYYLKSIQNEYLTAEYDERLDKDSHLSRLLRDYGTPSIGETLHYTNRTVPNEKSYQYLAIQRPSLNIEKATLHFPGCRFPRLNAIENDFFHSDYDARPWDDDFSTYCGPNHCKEDPTFLNCTKIIENGNEFLVFDNRPFQIIGNGLTPDITSLGDHDLGTNALFDYDDVVHKVYMKDADSNPAIKLDGVCDYDTNGNIITVNKPLFSSHSVCNTGEIIDFADGYACQVGELPYFDQYSEYEYNDILDALNVPKNNESIDLLIFLGDGILIESGIRLDCGCLLVNCDGAEEGNTICSIESFIDQDGYYDWSCDHLSIEPILKLEEKIGTNSMLLDGSIQSLVELII